MSLKELEAEVKALKAKVSRLEDEAGIQRLQNIYGFYLEHWLVPEVVELFADLPDTSVEMSISGVYLGKEGVKRYFAQSNPSKEFLHQIIQVEGVIDVAEDGLTAIGRWYGFGMLAMPSEAGVWQGYNNGIYECEYVKINGKWMFKKIHWNRIFLAPYSEGWVKPERQLKGQLSASNLNAAKPDLPTTSHNPYPSGVIVPFHFKHPITGKEWKG